MDRAWQATVCGIARVGHDLAAKPPPPMANDIEHIFICFLGQFVYFL